MARYRGDLNRYLGVDLDCVPESTARYLAASLDRDFGAMPRLSTQEAVHESLIRCRRGAPAFDALAPQGRAVMTSWNPASGLEEWTDGRQDWLVTHPGKHVVVHRVATTSDVYISDEKDAYALLRSEVTHGVRASVTAHGMWLAHAALVRQRGSDTAALVIGEKGAGKTTTCLLALAVGAIVYTDEMAVCRSAANAWTAAGIPRRIGLDDGHFDRYLPHLRDHRHDSLRSPLDGRTKRLLPINVPDTDFWPIGQILFPSVGAPHAAREILAAQDVVAALFRAFGGGADIRVTQQLASATPAVRLRFGPDLADNRHLLAEALESSMTGASA